MGEYEDKHIFDTLEEINEKYFLPHIQRPFVWKEEQILRLFDSLLRGYPIGTFLFWTTKDLSVRRRKFMDNFYKKYNKDFNIEKLGLEDTDNTRKDVTLVLDGQQRLQSLYVALMGKYDDKELYFDMLSGEKENEEGILFRFDFSKKQPKGNGEDLWVRAKDLLAKLGKEKKSFTVVTEETLKTFGIDESKRKTISENVEKFYRALISEKKITFYPETEESPERVFDIFVRVNSGGTQLSKSDLLFSFIKLKWKKFEAEKALPNLLEKINGNEQFAFDIDFILKTSVVLLGFPAKYTVKTFSGLRGNEIAEKIENNWLKICESITSVVDLIRDEFNIKNKKLLPSNNALIPIIYYSYSTNKKSKSSFDEEDKKTIRNWLLNALLSGSFSGHSDNVIDKAKKTIDYLSPKRFPSKEINLAFKGMRQSTEVNKEIMKGISYRSPESYLLLYLIYPYNTNFNPSSDANYPEQDHIFSHDELDKSYDEEQINRVGNLRLITSNANKVKSGTPYAEWIKKESEKELRLALIPDKPENWNIKNYLDFVQKREEKILRKVKEVL
jgi:uncharacterized protein with ParB-like and HNH nuclease domain